MLNLPNQMLLIVAIVIASMATVFATTNVPSFVENTSEEFAANNQAKEADESASGDEMESSEEADLDEVGSEDELPPIDEEMGAEEPEGL